MAFGCFHWFCTPKAIYEIKRVLKSTGLFIVVNKRDTGLFRGNFRRFLEHLEGQSVVELKADYQPVDMLTSQGFSVEIHTIHAKEVFAKEDLLSYCQSISLWTSLSTDKQKHYTPHILEFINAIMTGKEYYEREIEVQCLIASPLGFNP